MNLQKATVLQKYYPLGRQNLLEKNEKLGRAMYVTVLTTENVKEEFVAESSTTKNFKEN